MKNSNAFAPFVLMIALFFVSIFEAHAGGPWLLKKGNGYFQFQSTLLAYGYKKLLTGFAIKDSRGINREVYTIDYGLYGEYGLTDKLDVLASIPFKYAISGDETGELHFPNLLDEGSINGLSNVRFGLKYGLLDKDLKVAISAQASLNTVSTELEKGLATGVQANSFGLFGHVGGAVGEKWYAFAELGFMKYTDDFSDVIEGRIEVGRNLGDKFTMMLTTDIRKSLENGSYFNENLVQTGLYPNDQGWMASTLKVNYAASEKFGMHFGTAFIPIHFNNVGFSGSFTVGAYVKL